MKLVRNGFFILISFLAIIACADARFPRGGGSGGGGAQFVLPLKIGAGGWNTGLSVANDGTRYTRTDTYGGFKFNTSNGLWEQFVTQTSMPAAAFGYFPTTGTSQVLQGSGGVYEIDVVPSDSSKVYMIFGGRLFASTDGAATWVLKNLPAQLNDGQQVLDPNTSYRQSGRKMAVDPNNYLHLFVGTSQGGLYETTDGGANFTSVTGVPTSITYNGAWPGYNIAFDPSSSFSGGKTQTVYVFQNSASPSMYKTTNGGTSWAATTSGPTTMDHMIVSAAGTVWATDDARGIDGNGGDVWKYSGGAWTHVTGSGAGVWFCGMTSGADYCHAIAVDPVTPSRILFVSAAGDTFVSTNTGASTTALTKTITGTDVPWLPLTGGINYMAVGDVVFDKSAVGQVIMGMGLGTFTSTPPNSGSATWTSLNAGQEQLVTVWGIAPNGVPITGNEDRATFALTSPNTYPSIQNNTYHNSLSLAVTYGIDYAAGNKNFMAALITTSAGGAGNTSGTSTDGGINWRPFNSYYQDNISAASVVNDGTNKVKITVPSTTGLTTWANGFGSIVRVISYNQSNGSSGSYWPVTVNDATHITLQGSNTVSNFNLPSTGLYMVYVETEPLSNYNGGLNVTGAVNNGSGLVRVTFSNTFANLSPQQKICISGVVGTTEANGCFVIATVVSSNVADLYGTTFSHAYVSGGVGTYLILNGGTIAVADVNNMVIVPSNNSFPICTTDGGQTWAEKIVPAGVTTGADSGWGFALWTFRHTFAADRVTANTFYGYNYNQGVYKMTNCGTPTIVSGSQINSGVPGYTANTAASGLFPAATVSSTLKTIPGYAGHLIFAGGAVGSVGDPHPASTNLFRSIDGGANWFVTANVSEPIRIDCDGAIAPGSDYPTCYMVGWVSNDYGTWRTTATAAQWATCTGSGTSKVCGTAVTWTKVASYPLGSMDGPMAIMGDGVTWNKWYQGFGGSGWVYGQQN